jgi:hypothetical protein
MGVSMDSRLPSGPRLRREASKAAGLRGNDKSGKLYMHLLAKKIISVFYFLIVQKSAARVSRY